MSGDRPADPPPGRAPRPGGPGGPGGRQEWRALAAVRERTVDEPMAAVDGSTFRLQLFTAPQGAAGVRPVAVVTQVAGEEGRGLMNGAEGFAGAVWQRYCPQEEVPPVWVERQLWAAGSRQESRFRLVVFAGADRYRPSGPRWTVLTDGQVRDLVGAEVAADRGAGYVPRPAAPEPRPVFERFAVARLGRPRPFREPACMPAGVPGWRRWLRQVRPDRGVRSCCWYHGGDWHAVNALALQVLRRALAQGVDGEDLEDFATAQAAAAGASTWQTQALATLFSLGDAIQPDSENGYVNGQHRAQAMLEAGVRRTVVLRFVDEEQPGR